MEQNYHTSNSEMGIDEIAKVHLYETARWAKFLAICGFILLFLMIVYSLYMIMNFSTVMNNMEELGDLYGSKGIMSGMGTMVFIFYIIMAIICFFPFLFLFRFAGKMKTALASNEQAILNDSFRNLKFYYQYIGILTILFLVLMVLGILSFITAFSSM